MASVQIVWTFNLYQYMLPGGVNSDADLPLNSNEPTLHNAQI